MRIIPPTRNATGVDDTGGFPGVSYPSPVVGEPQLTKLCLNGCDSLDADEPERDGGDVPVGEPQLTELCLNGCEPLDAGEPERDSGDVPVGELQLVHGGPEDRAHSAQDGRGRGDPAHQRAGAAGDVPRGGEVLHRGVVQLRRQRAPRRPRP
eukprot:738436-Prorocentrum_minimum.AAC.1